MTAGLPDRAADRERAVLNTDRELYREDTGDPAGSYYENSVHVTASGSIGMNVGGTVIVRPIEEWHRAALAARPAPDDGEARVYTCRCSSLGLCPEHAAQDAAQDAAPSSPGSGDAQLAVVRDLTARAFRAEAAVERVREFVDGFADRGGGHVTATDELWILSLRRALDGPQSPPSDRRRAEGGGRMYLGESRSGVTSRDETEGRR